MKQMSMVIFLSIVLFIILSGCAPSQEVLQRMVQESIEAIPTQTAYPTYTPSSINTPYPTYTPYPSFTQPAPPTEVTVTETPVPTQVPILSPDFPIAFFGPGDKVLDVTQWGEGVVSIIVGQAEDNFIVTQFDANGDRIRSLVNVIVGTYAGTRPINWNSEKVANLQVDASQIGEWVITYIPIDGITDVLSIPGKRESAMDNVFRLDGFSGETATLTHDGEENFIVTAYDSNLERLHSVVNEIGPYSGTIMLPKETSYLEVEADGKWSIAIPGN